MTHGDYEGLTAQAADQVWLRLRAGHATKPTARELWLCTGTVRAHLLRCDGSRRPWRPASMVSLAVAANGGTKRYRAARADQSAWACAARPKTSRLTGNPQLRRRTMRRPREGVSL